MSAYSTSIPSREVRIKPPPLLWVLAAPYTDKSQDGEVGRELGGFRGLYRGEFHDGVCQNLPFDRCSWLVPNVELTQLYGLFHQSSRGF